MYRLGWEKEKLEVTYISVYSSILEEGMATHSSIVPLRVPRTEETGRLQSKGLQSWAQLKRLNTHTHTHTHTQ